MDTHDGPARASRHGRRRAIAVSLAVGALGVTAFGAARASATTPFATATLRDANGEKVGRVRFFSYDDHTLVRVRLSANAHVTADQFHGFHVHVGSDAASGATGCIADPAAPASTWFVSAGGHLKADGQVHGHHNGDLQSLLVAADGTARSVFTTDRFMPSDLANRAIVLHAGTDNFGNVPVGNAADQYSANSPSAVTKTANTGNAGDRVACGVIDVGRGNRDGARDD